MASTRTRGPIEVTGSPVVDRVDHPDPGELECDDIAASAAPITNSATDDDMRSVVSTRYLAGRGWLASIAFVVIALTALAGCGSTSEQGRSSSDRATALGFTNVSCDPNYSGCVPLVDYDLDCADIGRAVEVVGVDVNRFDADGDGYGCETYG